MLSAVEPLTTPYDRERLEDVGFMTCMTLVLLGNYAQTGHFGGPLAYTPYNVATHLAASHPVDGVVLVVPYDSGVSIVQSMMPLYPIAWIVRHRFETIADAPKVRAPTIFFVAARDAFGSAERSHRLYDHWGSASRTWVDLPNANHYTATADPLYWQRLGEFLRGL